MELSQTAKDLERMFLTSFTVFPEHSKPVHERWTDVLVRLPAVRGRDLSADMTDVFQEAEARGDRVTVSTAFNLSCLQNRYAQALYRAGLIPSHMLQVIIENGLYWQQRLLDRYPHAPTTRRMDDRIRKTKPGPVTQPRWIN